MPFPLPTYPARLVPEASFTRLTKQQLKNGVILRSFKDAVYPSSAGGKVNPDIFSNPNTARLVENISVNLMGTFKSEDAAWVFTSLNHDIIHADWLPGTNGITPSVDTTLCGQAQVDHDAGCAQKPASWGYWWVPITIFYDKVFKLNDIEYTCTVEHVPTQCNYWHIELRFCDPHGNNAKALDVKDRKKLASLVKMVLTQAAKDEMFSPNLRLVPGHMVHELQ